MVTRKTRLARRSRRAGWESKWESDRLRKASTVITILGFIATLLVLVVAVLTYLQARKHHRERIVSDLRNLLTIQFSDPRSWPVDTATGLILGLRADAAYRGSVESPTLTIEALIDDVRVGRSSTRTLQAHTLAAGFEIPLDTPQPFQGSLTLRLLDARGEVLDSTSQTLVRPVD